MKVLRGVFSEYDISLGILKFIDIDSREYYIPHNILPLEKGFIPNPKEYTHMSIETYVRNKDGRLFDLAFKFTESGMMRYTDDFAEHFETDATCMGFVLKSTNILLQRIWLEGEFHTSFSLDAEKVTIYKITAFSYIDKGSQIKLFDNVELHQTLLLKLSNTVPYK